jgi:hypothetical protein
MRECLSKGNLAGDKIAPAATLVWAKRQEVSERDQDLKEASARTADRTVDVGAGLADGWRPVQALAALCIARFCVRLDDERADLVLVATRAVVGSVEPGAFVRGDELGQMVVAV